MESLDNSVRLGLKESLSPVREALAIVNHHAINSGGMSNEARTQMVDDLLYGKRGPAYSPKD